jgi:hypothetical protein
MVQRFIMVNNNYLLTQVELEGANGATLSSNSMSPIVTTQPGSIKLPNTPSDPRFLLVPFDNDSFNTYNDASTYNGLYMASSYEVGVFHDGGSRNGLVLGSVTHDTWKTGIIANAAYGTFGVDTVSVVGGHRQHHRFPDGHGGLLQRLARWLGGVCRRQRAGRAHDELDQARTNGLEQLGQSADEHGDWHRAPGRELLPHATAEL